MSKSLNEDKDDEPTVEEVAKICGELAPRTLRTTCDYMAKER